MNIGKPQNDYNKNMPEYVYHNTAIMVQLYLVSVM